MTRPDFKAVCVFIAAAVVMTGCAGKKPGTEPSDTAIRANENLGEIRTYGTSAGEHIDNAIKRLKQ